MFCTARNLTSRRFEEAWRLHLQGLIYVVIPQKATIRDMDPVETSKRASLLLINITVTRPLGHPSSCSRYRVASNYGVIFIVADQVKCLKHCHTLYSWTVLPATSPGDEHHMRQQSLAITTLKLGNAQAKLNTALLRRDASWRHHQYHLTRASRRVRARFLGRQDTPSVAGLMDNDTPLPSLTFPNEHLRRYHCLVKMY